MNVYFMVPINNNFIVFMSKTTKTHKDCTLLIDNIFFVTDTYQC